MTAHRALTDRHGRTWVWDPNPAFACYRFDDGAFTILRDRAELDVEFGPLIPSEVTT